MKHFLPLFFCLILFSAKGQNSVLSSGKWYKISVDHDGIYKIDYNLLKKIGVNPDAINPQNLKIYAGFNGMLPQANNAFRYNDLQEVAIHIEGESDGRFNSNDYILFFGQGPDVYDLNASKATFYYQNNLYTDKNFYFISVGDNAGKRISVLNSIPGNFPIVNEFENLSYYETEKTNELHSGREWFGEQFDTKLEYTIRFEISNIVENSPIKVISNVMAQSFAESSFQIFLNDVQIGEQKVDKIENLQYAIKGIERTDTLVTTSAIVSASSRTNQDVKVRFTKATSGRSIGYLDYLLVQTRRKLSLSGDQMVVYSLKSLEQPVSTFSITGMSSAGFIWDITDSFNALSQSSSITNGTSTFSANSSTIRKYIVSSGQKFPAPSTESVVENQNLHGISSVDLVVVTAPEFRQQAERFGAYRASASSIKVVVASTSEVYNEFSGGKQDVTAIRDLMINLFARNTGIKNLLLFGRGSFDYKNYLSYNRNFVPIYESRNSLSPLETYSSDDYFGFLETSEGNWGENPPENHTLDIGVGRIPVKTTEEAGIAVDKIIQFENDNWGSWRKEIAFVADDGDFNIHQSQADELAEDLEALHPDFNSQKIYIDAFKQVNKPAGQVSPEATTELANAVRKGVAIVNYTGHGGEQQLMQERIFDPVSLDLWKTNPHYPLLITATCEFGRNDDPGIISAAELALFRRNAGVIGLLTTARPVNSGTNFTLNKAFYQALFVKNQNRYRDLGSIMRDTKNSSISGVSNRNFSLLSDPSMKIPLPGPELRTTEITNLSSASDTLKALSKIRVKGSLYQNGVPDVSYNGTLTATLFDKPVKVITKGDENPPYEFKTRDNAIFRGQASVRNGAFEFEFIVPSTIDKIVGQGKLSLYASPASAGVDYTGSSVVLKIGATEKNPGVDTKGPDIQLFMGDTTFINGGIAGKSSKLVAILSDDSGINTSTFVPAKAITAIIDDSLSFIVSKYYQSDINNPKRGKFSYPIDNLAPGSHTYRLNASDTYGNTSTTVINFIVAEGGGIQIEQCFNYPNPFSGSTTVRFKHNRSGEDIDATVAIYDYLGQTIMESTYQIDNSPYQVDLPAWEGTGPNGTKLGAGLYLLKLSVRSLLDGSKNDKITKVIITN